MTPRSPELAQLFDSWLYALGASKPSPHTLAAYRADLTGMADRLGRAAGISPDHLTLGNLSKSALRRAFASWAADHAASSVRRAHSTWNGFFQHLVSEDLAEGNPMAAVGKPKEPDSPVKAIRGDAMMITTRLLETAVAFDPVARRQWPERDAALVATFAVTGIRLSEAIGLTMRSLDGPPDHRRLTVVGKGNKTRVIPVAPALDRLLETYAASRRERFPDHDLADPGTPLFVDSDGQRPSRQVVEYWVECLYRRAAMRSDVPPGALVHALRHTFAMGGIAGGASVLEVQALLGHASLATTQRYVRATAEGLRGAVASHPAQGALEAFAGPAG